MGALACHASSAVADNVVTLGEFLQIESIPRVEAVVYLMTKRIRKRTHGDGGWEHMSLHRKVVDADRSDGVEVVEGVTSAIAPRINLHTVDAK